MRTLIIIAHDMRSTHNVGSLLRTAEGIGVVHVYFTGYSPYPSLVMDTRLPHITAKLTKQISKTALGAERLIAWSHHKDVLQLLKQLKVEGFEVVGLEQSPTSIPLPDYIPGDKVALLLGREVEGIEAELLAACDAMVEIPMFGTKESFNVVQAAAMALYHCRFVPSAGK